MDSSLYYAYIALLGDSKYHSINNLANTYSIMAEDYLVKHNDDSAKKYFNLFKGYNDSIILKKKIEYVSKLKLLHETDKLLNNIRIQKQKLNEYNLKTRFLIVVMILVLIALIIFILLYKRIQISYKKIVKESVQSLRMEKEIKLLRQKLSMEFNHKKNNSATIKNSDKIYYEIIKLLEENKLYTDHTFTLNKLSELIDVNRTYISNIINLKTGDSFVKLVNTYRVEEAKQMLMNEENKNLTLEAIGKSSGFKSTSSFYRVFKKETGVTPSFFIKNKNSQ